MTAKELVEHYAAIKVEIGQLEHEIADLCSKGWRQQTDSVLASPAHEPFQNRPIPISGAAQSRAIVVERKKLVKLYDQKLKDLYFWQGKAEEIFSRVPDTKARVILRFRYIDGMEWNDIANKIGGDATEASVKMYARRSFEKI